MDFPFKKLVFSGGGVWGIAYGGAAKALDQAGVFAQIDGVAGTSAGSIAALLVALKYTPAQLQAIISATPFASFAEDPELFSFLDSYGLFSSQPVADWLVQQVEGAGGNFNPAQTLGAGLTFAQLAAISDVSMRVFASDLNTRSTQIFDADATPTVAVVDAVRASMSIPAFFQTFQFPGANPNGDSYVDGGVLLDYAIETFDREVDPATVLGLHLGLVSATLPRESLGKDDVTQWISLLFNSFLRSQDENLLTQPANLARTVQIPTANIVSAFNFFLSEQQIQQLETSGFDATQQFLQGQGKLGGR